MLSLFNHAFAFVLQIRIVALRAPLEFYATREIEFRNWFLRDL